MPIPEPRFPNPGRAENEVPLPYGGPWYATVTKVSRWRYRIDFQNGDEPLMQDYRALFVTGSRTRVNNRARRELNRRNRPTGIEQWTVGKPAVKPEKPPEGGSGVTPPSPPADEQQPHAVTGTAATAKPANEAPPVFGFTPRRRL